MGDIPDTKVPDTQEFFENQSQTNALNAKRTYDEYQDIALTSARRSQGHYDDLNSRTVASYDQLLTLQARLNEEHFASVHELRKHLANIQVDRQRHADIWTYETAYDLGNPVTTGTGDTLRSTAYTPNRASDVGAAGVTSANEAIAAAVAQTVNTSMTPLIATLTTMVETLAAVASKIAAAPVTVTPTPAA